MNQRYRIKMKKHVFLTFAVAVIFSMVGVMVSGQTNTRRTFDRNDFWDRRNVFLTAEIGLTTEEVSKFIPLENEFKMKLFEIGRDCRRLTQESQAKKNISDAEYMKAIDCYLENRLKEAQLEKDYFEKFKKILKPEKLYKYHQADAKFSREYVIVRRPAGERDNDNNRNSDRNNTNTNRNRR